MNMPPLGRIPGGFQTNQNTRTSRRFQKCDEFILRNPVDTERLQFALEIVLMMKEGGSDVRRESGLKRVVE
jgi:hypothetical protein